MTDKTEVWLGTLSLMVLRTLATMGPQHGYGLARRIEHISCDHFRLHFLSQAKAFAQELLDLTMLTEQSRESSEFAVRLSHAVVCSV